MKSSIFFKSDSETYSRINTNDIEYVHAQGDYVSIHLKDKRYVINTSMSKMMSALPSKFFMVHRSYIVNLEKITSVIRGSDSAVYIGEFSIPVSETYKKELINKLNIV